MLVENWHGFAPESRTQGGRQELRRREQGTGDARDHRPPRAGRPVRPAADHGPERRGAPLLATGPADRRVEEQDTAEAKRPKRTDLTEEEARGTRRGSERGPRLARRARPDQQLPRRRTSRASRSASTCRRRRSTSRGSGYPEGQPFPWLVSDFGLVDAIESGHRQDSPAAGEGHRRQEGRRRPARPEVFPALAQHHRARCKPSEKHGSGKPKAEVVLPGGRGRLKQIAGQWLERFQYIQQATPDQERVPPVLIVVCDNTDIADYFYRKISGESEAETVTLQDVEDVESGEDEDETPTGQEGQAQEAGRLRPERDPAGVRQHADRKVHRPHRHQAAPEAESEDPAKTKQDSRRGIAEGHRHGRQAGRAGRARPVRRVGRRCSPRAGTPTTSRTSWASGPSAASCSASRSSAGVCAG